MPSRVSVIIPCYEDSATLGRAIASLYAQTAKVYEIIVVNDCSPQTAEIERVVAQYSDKTRYIVNDKNRGLAASRNRGVEEASGDIVTFLDADDELHPQKIELQLSCVSPNVAVACNLKRIIGHKHVSGHKRFQHIKPQVVTDIGHVLYRNRLTGASIMVHKALLESVGKYDESLRSCEDFDLWIRLIKAGVIVYNVPLPLYLYYLKPGSLSNNLTDISYWEMEVLKKYFRTQKEALSGNNQAAMLWAFYLLKHFVRYEICKDERLLRASLSNLNELARHPMLKASVYVMHKLKFLGAPRLFYER